MAHTFVKARDLDGYRVQAVDGEVGWVRDLLVDDVDWRVRYLVVETGGWYEGGPVLLVPRSVTGIDPQARHVDVMLSRDQVRESPSLDMRVANSRELDEDTYERAYGWAEAFDARLGSADVPTPIAPPADELVPGDEEPFDADRLHSTQMGIGARVEGSDGALGQLSDLLVDDSDWSVRYLELTSGDIDPSGRTAGRRVLIEPGWLGEDGATWPDEQRVRLEVSRAAVAQAPIYTGSGEVDADLQGRMATYWQAAA